MSERIGRRRFLEVVGAAPLAGAMAMRQAQDASGLDGVSAQGAGKRIVVLGAGLAGLSAAYFLMRHGYDVVVLEGQRRSGGRVHTAREGFAGEGFAELGAIRIFETHAHTMKYVRMFGLQLAPYPESGGRAFYLQGRRFLHPAPGERWPLDGFTAEEQPDPYAMFPKYLGEGFDRLGDPFDRRWPGAFPSTVALDRVTLEQHLAAQGASRTWREWFFALEGRIGRVNGLAGLTAEKVSVGAGPHGIVGGNDRLPHAFAQALGSRVKYGCRVVRLTARHDGVTVNMQDRGGLHEIRADRCVCALPFAPLRRVTIEAPFSTDKRRAIASLQYMAAARCYFQTSTPFWTRDPLGALSHLKLIGTDTMIGRIWNMSALQPDRSLGLIQSYMIDTDALAYTAIAPDMRLRRLRRVMRDVLPGLDDRTVHVQQKAWHEDPWQGGGWAWLQPGELTPMFDAIRRPEARVHFAGEHTSLWFAWMNGALESGERVVREILEFDRGADSPN